MFQVHFRRKCIIYQQKFIYYIGQTLYYLLKRLIFIILHGPSYSNHITKKAFYFLTFKKSVIYHYTHCNKVKNYSNIRSTLSVWMLIFGILFASEPIYFIHFYYYYQFQYILFIFITNIFFLFNHCCTSITILIKKEGSNISFQIFEIYAFYLFIFLSLLQ